MKSLLLFLALQLSAYAQLNSRPEGCKSLSTDSDWPAPAVWKAALPGVVARPAQKAGRTAPDYRLPVQNAEDVQKAVRFANEHNIRLTIINTGHDYMGRCDAPSGLQIDVSNLKGVRVLSSFTPTPQGAQSPDPNGQANVITPIPGQQAAVTFGASLSTQMLNNAVAPSKLFTHGAAHGGVSVAGGWGQMGGHGPLTSSYGLGVDQWLEAKVVTADGQLKVANKVSNPDLFWAIRGGGGGAWGVVVEATVKAYPDIPITAYNWYMNTTAGPADLLTGGSGLNGIADAVMHLTSQMPAINGQGITLFLYPEMGTLRGFAIHPGDIAGTAKANAVWEPILKNMSAHPGVTPFQTKPYEFKSFKEFYDITYGKMNDNDKRALGIDSEHGAAMRGVMNMMYKRNGQEEEPSGPRNPGLFPMDSRLLTAEHIQSEQFKQTFKNMHATIGMLFVAGNKVNHPDDDTSVNPAWRKAIVHSMGVNFAPVMSMDPVRKLAPEMGAYGNEAFYNEPNWKQSFWGSNYPKLSEVKTKYDPNMTFWVSPGINADTMHVVNGRVCKVSSPLTSLMAPATDNQNHASLTEAGELFGSLELIGTQFPAPGTLEGIRSA